MLTRLLRRLLRGSSRLPRGVRRLLGGLCGFARLLRRLLRRIHSLCRVVRLRHFLRSLGGLLRILYGLVRLGPGFRGLLFGLGILRGFRLLLRVLRGLLRRFRRLLGLLRGLRRALLGFLHPALLQLRLRFELLRHIVLATACIGELLLGIGERILGNRAQLLLHRGILRQLRLELLEQLLRILLRHLREHLRVRLLLVELLLDAQFLLHLAQRRARIIQRLPLLHLFKMIRDLLQRIGELLLLLRRAFEVCLLLLRRGGCRILQGLLRLRRRVLQHRERIIRVAHLLALILLQNVLLVRIRAHEILQRLDLRIELLLLRDLLFRLRLRIGGILRLLILRALLRLLLHLRLLLRERRGELAHRRRKLRQLCARIRHRLAQKIQRELHLPREFLRVLPRGRLRKIKIPALAHLALHRAPRLELLRLPEDLLRSFKRLRLFQIGGTIGS